MLQYNHEVNFMQTTDINKITIFYEDARLGAYKTSFPIVHDDNSEHPRIMHSHEFYELHFILENSYEYSFLQKEIVLHKNELLIIPPRTEHYPFYLPKTSSINVCIYITLEKLNNQNLFFDYFKSSLDNASLKPISVSENLIKNVKRFVYATNSTIEDHCILKASFAEIIYNLFNDINNFDMQKTSTKNNDYNDAVLFLIDEMSDNPDFTLTDISQKIGYSTRHTARLIKNIYGMPLSEIRTKLSLEAAKKLLKTTNMSVEEISTSVGFSSTASLRRAFLKFENTTPRKYKNSHQRKIAYGNKK